MSMLLGVAFVISISLSGLSIFGGIAYRIIRG